MSNRLFATVCPVVRTAPSRKRARRRTLLTGLLLLTVAPPLVALGWQCAARAAADFNHEQTMTHEH